MEKQCNTELGYVKHAQHLIISCPSNTFVILQGRPAISVSICPTKSSRRGRAEYTRAHFYAPRIKLAQRVLLCGVSRGLTLAGLAIVLQFLSRGTLAVEAPDGVAAEGLTSSVGLLTLVHI